jgi:hypothetical protein
MSILLSERQTDDLCVPFHTPPSPAYDEFQSDTKQFSTTFTAPASQNRSSSSRMMQNWYVWDRIHGFTYHFADRLPARSWAEEQWSPRQEVDERYPDAKEGKLHLF